MSGCRHNDRDATGEVLDFITGEPIPRERLIKIRRGRLFFCYDVLSLLRWVRQRTELELEPTLPNTGQSLEADELDAIEDLAFSLLPLSYYLYVRTPKETFLHPTLFPNVSQAYRSIYRLRESDRRFQQGGQVLIYRNRFPATGLLGELFPLEQGETAHLVAEVDL
jgi:hypothetical protein